MPNFTYTVLDKDGNKLKDKIESVLPTELLKRDKRYIERYIIKAIIEYKKMKIVEEDELDF